MKAILITGILILLTPFFVCGQSFSVAPYSFKFLGVVDGASSIALEYELPFLYNNENGSLHAPVIGLHYFHQWDKREYRFSERFWRTTKTSTIAFSAVPLNLKYARLGGIVAVNNFPLSISPRTNFYAQLVMPLGRFDIRYTHISNGFGIISDINPGLDTISLHVHF